jgi:hypothetical protein
MSDVLEPISPSEAAQILSNSRWKDNEGEQPVGPFGLEATERGMGYEPMTPAIPVKAPIESDITAEQLGSELLKEREGRPVDIERSYNHMKNRSLLAPSMP